MNALRDNSTTCLIRNRTISETPGLDSYPDHKTSIVIWKVVPPILILLGTLGNILSILVLTRNAIRTSTTSLYLTVLAFSDLIVLYTGLLRHWLVYCFEIDVRLFSKIGCKIHIWLVYSFLDFSSWVLMLVTIERVIAVWLPFRVKGICTRCSACVCIASTGLFLLLLNSHVLYGFGFVYFEGNLLCNVDNQAYSLFFLNIWSWTVLCLYSLIPVFVIVTGNVLILTKLVKSRNNASRNRALYGRNSHMTVVLLTLNVFFLVSNTPVSIYNMGYEYWAGSKNVQTTARLNLTFSIVTMLMYSNNVFNFLLYCLTGTKMRRELIRMFCPEKPVTSTTPLSNLPRTDDACIVTSLQIPRYRFLPE